MKCFDGLRLTGTVALLATLMVATAAAQQPTMVLTIRGIDAILDDAEFIGAEIGHDGVKGTADQFLTSFAGGLAGVDRSKPFGVFWNATASGSPDMPVAFVPVSDVEGLKKLLGMLTADFKDNKGQWSMTLNDNKLFAKVSGGYCFISNVPTALTKLPDPSKIVNSKYDFALDLSVASIPDEFKETFLTAMESGLQQAAEQAPEASTEAEKALRELLQNSLVTSTKDLVNDSDRLTLGIDIDKKSRLFALDFGLTGKSNTNLAKSMTAFGKLQPVFAGIGADSSPLRVVFSYPTTGIVDQVDSIMKSAREAAESQIETDDHFATDAERKTAKGLAGRLIDIFQATVKTGSMHSGLVIEPADEGKLRIISGSRVARGDDLGKVIDEAIKLSKDDDVKDKIKLDAAKHAGARIHAITIDADEEDDFSKLLGADPGHIAIRSDSVWIALGTDNLTALKKALDAKPLTKPSSPISLQVKPGALVAIMEKNDEKLVERAKELAGKPGDKLTLEVAPVPNGAKLRLEIGVDVLQLAEQQDN